MSKIPSLPRGYTLLPRGESYSKRDAMLLQHEGRWVTWDRSVLYLDWIYTSYDFHGGPFFAVPKPRYTCPLEFSRYV